MAPSSAPGAGPGAPYADGFGFFGGLPNLGVSAADGSPRPESAVWLDAAAIDQYDCRGFNLAGIHRDTATRFDPSGFDVFGYDLRGFDSFGIHRDTYTAFGPDGFDRTGYDEQGFDCNGRDRQGYDRDGYDPRGYDVYRRDRQGYDPRGFDARGIHRDTGTPFSPAGYDRWARDPQGNPRWGAAR